MTGVLGVPTLKYAPYAFFNILNPLIALVYGFTGFRVERIATREVQDPAASHPMPRSRR
jgi:NhaC family Na+:H+ antiporter